MDNKGKIIEISSVDSTNNYASEMLKKQKLAEGSIIWAQCQFQGRGQKGNIWSSEDYKNITCSIVISPEFLPIDKQFFLSVLTSVSILEFLKKKINSNLSIKWPNDIYYKNLKLGGILIENIIFGSSIRNSIIGIGLNINQKDFPKEVPNPVSVFNITNKEYNIKNLLEELLDIFFYYYKKLKKGDTLQLKDLYMKNIYRFGKIEKYKDKDGLFSGKIINVLDSGELVINDETENQRLYFFKEVEFII